MALENSEMVVESMIRSCFYPFFRTIASAVRGKECPYWQHIGRDILLRRTSLTVWHLHPTEGCYAWGTPVYTYMVQFANLRCHRCLYLTQRVESLDHGVEHRKQMSIAVKALYILLSAMFAAYFQQFLSRLSDFIS